MSLEHIPEIKLTPEEHAILDPVNAQIDLEAAKTGESPEATAHKKFLAWYRATVKPSLSCLSEERRKDFLASDEEECQSCRIDVPHVS